MPWPNLTGERSQRLRDVASDAAARVSAAVQRAAATLLSGKGVDGADENHYSRVPLHGNDSDEALARFAEAMPSTSLALPTAEEAAELEQAEMQAQAQRQAEEQQRIDAERDAEARRIAREERVRERQAQSQSRRRASSASASAFAA